MKFLGLQFLALAVTTVCSKPSRESSILEGREIPNLSVPNLIRYWGYECEEHFVTTADGYILGIHRVVSNQVVENKGVALLAHGLTSSSSQWVSGPPHNSMGLMLADLGYDVWLVNTRGNTYSRNHTTFEPCSSCPDFWNYCYHEGGTYDFPAIIDYITELTLQQKIFFVGHSMGTTQFLIMTSEKPEYNEKIRGAFLLAPAVFMNNAFNPIFLIAEWAGSLENLFHLLGVYEFLPHSDVITWLGDIVCNEDDHPIYAEVCVNVAFLLFGIQIEQLNKTMIPVYLDHIPAGVSTRPFVHYAQLHVNNNQFKKYDYGSAEENILHYGTSEPPEYDLSKVTAPVGLFAGENDDLASTQDVEYLSTVLPNLFHFEVLDYPKCSHMDFAIGIDAGEKIYKPIFKMMENF